MSGMSEHNPDDLPRWVWDVVADLIEYEGVHDENKDPCLEATFLRIPEDVRRAAAIVLRYREQPDERPVPVQTIEPGSAL